MKSYLLISWALVALLLGCGHPHPATEASVPAAPAIASAVVPPAVAPAPVAATPSARQLYEVFAAAADTTLRWQGQPYRLSWRVRLDTLRPLTYITPPDPAKGFRGDTSRGFQAYYRVEIRDSLGQRVGQHTFTKGDFYSAVGPELAVSSYAGVPRLLGHSEPLGGLVFTVPFNAPGTDWYSEAVLVLDSRGRMRYLADGPSVGGPDLTTTLSHDGRTLLTGSAICHAGRPPLPLPRAGAELRGAMLLNDTLALTIYEPGQLRTQPNGVPYLAATAAQRRQPNAFVRDVRDGHEVSRFRYDGFFEELGYTVPLHVVPQAHAVYLLDNSKGLYMVNLRQPAASRRLLFTALPRATGQPVAGGVSFELAGLLQHYRFWVDTDNAAHVRYQQLAE